MPSNVLIRKSRAFGLRLGVLATCCALVGPVSAQEEAFSVAVLPDTQHYVMSSDYYADLEIYEQQMDWIISKVAEQNIKFVAHVGDMTQHNTADQWIIAEAAQMSLDTAPGGSIAYNVTVGNHDIASHGAHRVTQWTSYFANTLAPRQCARPIEVDAQSNPAFPENNCHTFSAGEHDFVILSLEYIPRKDAVSWANAIIQAYSDHNVIVVTHKHLSRSGTYPTESADDEGDEEEQEPPDGREPRDLWRELLRRHSNVVLVLSGHYNGASYRRERGLGGNLVHQVLTDFQSEKRAVVNGAPELNGGGNRFGNGWMRLLRFVPTADNVFDIQVITFSVADWVGGSSSSGTWIQAGFPGIPDPSTPDGSDEWDDTWNEVWPQLWTQTEQYGDDFDVVSNEGIRRHNHRWNYTIEDVELSSSSYAYTPEDPNAPGGLLFRDRMANVDIDRHLRWGPRIAAAPSGDFVVVWTEFQPETGRREIRMRGFDRDGNARFVEKRVNAGLGGVHDYPDVAMDDNGNFVVVWQDDSDGNGWFQIRMRGYLANGEPRSDFPERTANAVAAGQQVHPAVSADKTGRFVVVWADDQEDDGYGIGARGFHADGTERFPQVLVTENTAGAQHRPAVAMLEHPRMFPGHFFVAWEDDPQEDGKSRVVGCAYSNESKVVDDFVVSRDSPGGDHGRPAVAADDKGRAVVVWEDDDDGNALYQIRARRMSFALRPLQLVSLGTEFTVNAVSTGQQYTPAVAMTRSGDFAVVWDDRQQTGVFDVLGKAYNADGSVRLADFRVNNDNTGYQGVPAVAIDEPSGPTGQYFVAAWEDDTDQAIDPDLEFFVTDSLVMTRNFLF